MASDKQSDEPIFDGLESLLDAMDSQRDNCHDSQQQSGSDGIINSSDDNGDDDSVDGMDEYEEADEAVQQVFDANIVPKTRDIYHRSMRRFSAWIFDQYRVTGQQKYRDLIHDDLYNVLHTNSFDQYGANASLKALAACVKPILRKANPSFHPINLSLLRVNDFIKYLLSLTEKGKYLSKSGYGCHRSALKDLFRECKVIMSDEFKADLEKSFSGLKRKSQTYKAEHGGKLGEGKQPLPFQLYKF
jgi:hypothetical protein